MTALVLHQSHNLCPSSPEQLFHSSSASSETVLSDPVTVGIDSGTQDSEEVVINDDSGTSSQHEDNNMKVETTKQQEHEYNEENVTNKSVTNRIEPVSDTVMSAPPPVQKCHGGLNNLGNTCYMNSALQMLASLDNYVDRIRDFKVPEIYEKQIDTTLRDAFLDVIGALAKGETVRPERLKEAMDNRSTLFVGYDQEDAHEFLSTLLDLLDEDYQKIEKMRKEDVIEEKEEENEEEEEKQETDNEMETEVLDDQDMCCESDSKKARKRSINTFLESEENASIVRCHSFSQLRVEEIEELVHGPQLMKLKPKLEPLIPVEPKYKLAGGRMSVSEAALTPYREIDVSMGETATFTNTAVSGSEDNAFLHQTSDEDEISPVESYFEMQVCVSLTCGSCHYARSHTEKYLHLSLEIGSESGCCVDDQLRKFFAPEERELKCEKCFFETATQKMEITKLPRALLLHFKRFIVDVSPDYTSISYRKNQSPFTFEKTLPLSAESGVLGDFLAPSVTVPKRIDQHHSATLSESSSKRSSYSIRSLVNHMGSSAGCGHYAADANKLYSDGTRNWTRFNDARVSRISEKNAISDSSRNVYMAMYEFT